MDLSQFTADDLAQLAALVTTSGQRSPIPKPLKDLREPTTAKGRLNRPHFEWSADPDPAGQEIKTFPRLFWDAQGQEKLIGEEKDMVKVQPDWTPYPPKLDPKSDAASYAAAIQAELESLSEDDRKFVLEAERAHRLDALKSRLVGMSDSARASVVMPAKAKK